MDVEANRKSRDSLLPQINVTNHAMTKVPWLYWTSAALAVLSSNVDLQKAIKKSVDSECETKFAFALFRSVNKTNYLNEIKSKSRVNFLKSSKILSINMIKNGNN